MSTVKAIIKDRRVQLDVPADWPDGAEVEVHRSIPDPHGGSLPPGDRESWRRFVETTAGSITDPSFERPPQGELEERELLP